MNWEKETGRGEGRVTIQTSTLVQGRDELSEESKPKEELRGRPRGFEPTSNLRTSGSDRPGLRCLKRESVTPPVGYQMS